MFYKEVYRINTVKEWASERLECFFPKDPFVAGCPSSNKNKINTA